MPVKPLTVVTKLGRMADPDRPLSWVHEDCVTLADAERYAREKSELAVAQACRNLEIRNGKLDELVGNLRRELEAAKSLQNHGAFYLETQADLVLKARVDELEKRVKELERNDLV